MLRIVDWSVFDLKPSVIACRNAMRTSPAPLSESEFEASLPRAVKLANTPCGCGEQTFLSGIRVSFDVVYPNYISPEMQRYHWFDIVTSSSKMHRLKVMAGRKESYNKYVTDESIAQMQRLADAYNETGSYDDFMRLVSNCPQGIELFMRVSTNYLQLKNIYKQRRHHKLKEDWGAFCDWVETLPYAREFIVATGKGEGVCD